MRNYILIWFCALPYRYLDPSGTVFSEGILHIIGQDEDEANEAAQETYDLSILDNQSLPPGYSFEIYIIDAVRKYFEMNKANVFSIIVPDLVVNSSLFVDESPRESWSHGQ